MLKTKMVIGAEKIIRRLEVSEGSFMDLINRKKLPARLNDENRWTIRRKLSVICFQRDGRSELSEAN